MVTSTQTSVIAVRILLNCKLVFFRNIQVNPRNIAILYIPILSDISHKNNNNNIK